MSEEIKEPALPRTYYVGRVELYAWLEKWGLKERQVRTLIESGKIPTHRIAGFARRRKYVPQEIVNVLGLGQSGGAQ